MLLRTASTFRRLWVGQFVSTIGDGMQRIALLWWAAQHEGNGLLVAVALSTVVPTVVFSPLGGWLADRCDRRLLMAGADLSRVGLSGLLAAMLFGSEPPAALVCVVVALAAIAATAFDPAYQAAVPTIVDDEHLPAANGLNMANGAVGGLLGPLAGGALIAVADIGWVMLVNAATFAWSAAWIASVRLPRPAGAQPSGQRSTIRESVREVRSLPGLGHMLALATTLNMVVAPVPMMIAALAVDRHGAGPAMFGALEMLLSAGLLVGSVAAGMLARGRLAVPFHVLGVCLALLGAVPLAAAGAALVIGGVAIAIANAEAMTRIQRSVPAEVQGRVFGVLGSLAEGLRPAGLALGAPLLAVAGVSGSFAVIGVSVVLATLVLARGLPAVAPAAPLEPHAGAPDEVSAACSGDDERDARAPTAPTRR